MTAKTLIPGYPSYKAFGQAVGLPLRTVCNHMKAGYCQWPRRVLAAQTLHPLYDIFYGMRQRCTKPAHSSYPSYGGQGITIDPAWGDFWKFVEDMGERPSMYHTLDRIDSSQGYSRENCRWATAREQAHNRRNNRDTPCVYERHGKFRAQLLVCGRRLVTPTFPTSEEAEASLDLLKQLYAEYL